MVGAGTVRTERYGRMVKNDELRERRARDGLEPDPVAVVVSARLNLPPDLPLLQDPDSHVVVVTEAEHELQGVRARVEYVRPAGEGQTRFELAPALAALRERFDVRTALCEGGAVLAAALLSERLVDELRLSLAPKLAAGDGPTLITGPAFEPPFDMTLVSVHEDGGHLFLRYGVRDS
jgi:riboflavin biosynthesis pyrimidine reductase